MPTATTCTLRFPGFQLRPLYPEFIGSRILFVQEILWKSRVRGTRMFPSPVWSVARAPEKCSIPKESRCIPPSSIHRVHTSLSLCKFSRVSFYEERMDGICSTLLGYTPPSSNIYTRWMYLDSLSRFRIKRFRFIVYKTSFLFSFSRKTNISNYFKYVISKDSKRIYTRWIYLDSLTRFRIKRFRFIVYKNFLFSFSRKRISWIISNI